jgi:hypothetical protein
MKSNVNHSPIFTGGVTTKNNEMEKTIKVTIKEFREHGGILQRGRDIFSGVNGTICGEYSDSIIDGLCEIRQSNATFQGDESFFAVEIKVIPIYQ